MAQTPSSSPPPDSFGARGTLTVGDASYEIYRINALADRYDVARLPYSIKVVLENLLRHEDGVAVRPADIEAVAAWGNHPERHGLGGADAAEIALTPERVLMQDFTGVPASSTWPPCATPSAPSAGTRPRSTRWSRWNWSSTTR